MVILCARHLAPSIHSKFPARWSLLNDISKVYCHIRSIGNRVKKQTRHRRMSPCSKRSSFHDNLVTFVKPSRLLPTDEVNTFTNYVPKDIFSTVILDKSDSFYMLELCTSREFSSSLQDKNAAILICLIDVDGDSLLQRIPAISSDCTAQGKEAEQSLPFQRGSVDIVTFKGPKLERIKALWIGLESGSWRLDGVNLKVIHGPLDMPRDNEGRLELKFDGVQYEFEKSGVLLGEEGLSAAEARPVAATDLSGVSLSALLEEQSSSASTVSSNMELKEDGMREYADLKLSSLLYDQAIVITGFAVLILSSNNSAAYSFLIGGFGGFLYLLLLQRSVDELPVIESPSEVINTEASTQGFNGLRRPWLILALIMAASAVALKYGIRDASFELTPTELFVGAAGFLANKVAVVLAAFKPLQSIMKTRDNSDV